LRIVGGRLRGRVMKAPDSRAIRPTSERLRESIFDILVHAYGDPVAGARVIDLFAGSGALGLEALSRGAAFALFVDDGAEARALLRANIETLGLGGSTRVFRRDATKLGDAPAEHSLAFLDPPYGKALAGPALQALVEGGWLTPGAVVVVEEDAHAAIAAPAPLRLAEERAYGDTKITIFVMEGTAPILPRAAGEGDRA
jgi:16S rRNA (guanine966-N2)-methyltransferase